MVWRTAGEVMRLKVGGLLWGGVPCSSWVFLNRHTSKRSREAPLGDEEQPSVRRANLLVTRWTLLVLLAVSRGCVWLAEQPMSSLMPEHPRLKQVCELGQTPNLPTHSWHNKTQTSKYLMCMFMPCCSIGFLRLLGHHAKVCGGALLDGALRPFQPEGHQGVWRCVWSLVNLHVCEGDPCPSPHGCPSPFIWLPWPKAPCCYTAICPQVGQQAAEG